MSAPIDERLSRLENLVLQIDERQRLTRFDTVMFLTYPIVILGLTTITTVILQVPSIVQTKVLGVPLIMVLLIVAMSFGGFTLYGFIRFLLAYLNDDLRERIASVRHIAFTLYFLPLFLLSGWLFNPTLPELTQVLPSPLGAILDGFLGFLVAIAAGALTLAIRDKLTAETLTWFKGNLPTRSALAIRDKLTAETLTRFKGNLPTRSLSPLAGLSSWIDYSQQARFRLSEASYLGIASSIVYVLMVAGAVLIRGLTGVLVAHTILSIIVFSITIQLAVLIRGLPRSDTSPLYMVRPAKIES